MPIPNALLRIELPESVKSLVTAHRALVESYSKTSLRFTLDGRLVGDIAEATAAAVFGLQLCSVRTPGVDAHSCDGRSVQIKASGIGKGPAFTPGEGRADHLIFLVLDFPQGKASILYNGPEAPIRAELPKNFSGTKRVPLSRVLMLDSRVAVEERLPRVR